LYEKALQALEEGYYYDVFIVMTARAQTLQECSDGKNYINHSDLEIAKNETIHLIEKLQETIDMTQEQLNQYIQSIPARKAYSSSQVYGEISSFLSKHQGES
jgi:uncharacterized protein YecA (UPF0149 family)